MTQKLPCGLAPVMMATLLSLLPVAGPLACKHAQGDETKDLEQIQNAEWHYKSGAGYFENHQVPLAIRELHVALEKDPDHAKAHYLLGYIYMGRRQYTKSMQHFKRVIELDETSYDAVNSLGATYLAMERWSDAVEIFERLVEQPMFVTPELAHNNAGWAYYNLGELTLAAEHFEMAVFLRPEFCLGFNNLGLVRSAQRQSTEAIKAYARAIELCPANYAEPHFHLAKVYLDYGDTITARNHFSRCVELAPQSALAERCQEYLSY